MKKIIEYTDEHLGKSYLVINHIREVSKTMGDVVITFSNGDKKVLNVADANATLKDILDALSSS